MMAMLRGKGSGNEDRWILSSSACRNKIHGNGDSTGMSVVAARCLRFVRFPIGERFEVRDDFFFLYVIPGERAWQQEDERLELQRHDYVCDSLRLLVSSELQLAFYDLSLQQPRLARQQ
jgi:hypothetical protein